MRAESYWFRYSSTNIHTLLNIAKVEYKKTINKDLLMPQVDKIH